MLLGRWQDSIPALKRGLTRFPEYLWTGFSSK